MVDLNNLDKTKFTNSPFGFKDITKPWGWEIIFTKPDDEYTGKLIHLNAGCRFSLQVHDKKTETQMLVSGRAKLIIDNDRGDLVELEMELMKGYKMNVGQRHRVQAITDCEIYEVSTPETGTTYRLEDDYKRPDQTEELRSSEREDLITE